MTPKPTTPEASPPPRERSRSTSHGSRPATPPPADDLDALRPREPVASGWRDSNSGSVGLRPRATGRHSVAQHPGARLRLPDGADSRHDLQFRIIATGGRGTPPGAGKPFKPS